MKRTLTLALCLMATLPGFAFEVESLALHLHLAAIETALPPEVVEDHLVLSAKGAYRFVGAAFEYENYTEIHAFEINRHGIFVLAYPVPPETSGVLRYRIVVDGQWSFDPANPRMERDERSGIAVSLASVPFLDRKDMEGYTILAEDGTTARFRFNGKPGAVVTVAGSFNLWDPFVHELSELSPGEYELELPLPPGMNYYAFIYEGEYVSDPLNDNRYTDRSGRVVSAVMVAGR